MGRQVANSAPGLGTGVNCTLDPFGTSTFNVSTSGTTVAVLGSDRPLRVLVALSGQVRQCDPARTLSSTAPDGCP
jgi:type IV fimbrial biogenesis protein FimT